MADGPSEQKTTSLFVNRTPFFNELRSKLIDPEQAEFVTRDDFRFEQDVYEVNRFTVKIGNRPTFVVEDASLMGADPAVVVSGWLAVKPEPVEAKKEAKPKRVMEVSRA